MFRRRKLGHKRRGRRRCIKPAIASAVAQDIVERRQLKAPLAEDSNAEVLCVPVGGSEHPEQELSLEQTLQILVAVDRPSQYDMAIQCGLGDTAETLIEDILAATPAVIATVQKNLPRRFPQHVLDAILKGLSKSAKQLEAMPAA